MEITEVRINLNKGGKVKAFAQIVIDDCFLIGDVRIMEGKEGTVFVTMPSRRLRNGSFRDIVHPLDTATRRRVDEAVMAEYQRVLSERGEDGDNGSRTQELAKRLLSERYWTDEEGEQD